MFISVVMSVFNGEKYLSEQLESILSQSRQPDEVIIINDCSTDSSKEMISSFILFHKLSNWKIIDNRENIGWRKSFINGLWTSTGDIVFLCDQDDIWHLDKIKIMESTMAENENILLLTSKYVAFYENGKRKIKPEKLKKYVFKQKAIKKAIKVKYPGCSYCVRRKLIDKSKAIWFEETPHDALLWRMAVVLDGLYTINLPLIDVRKHQSTFVIESKKRQVVSEKIKWLYYAKETFSRLYNFSINEENIRYAKILKKNETWILKRLALYESKTILKVFQLIPYIFYYEKFKHFLADIYLVFLRKKDKH